jgi:hypothetical protein
MALLLMEEKVRFAGAITRGAVAREIRGVLASGSSAHRFSKCTRSHVGLRFKNPWFFWRRRKRRPCLHAFGGFALRVGQGAVILCKMDWFITLASPVLLILLYAL